VRKSITLAFAAIFVAVIVAAGGGTAARAGGNVPMRDGSHGVWYVRACATPGAGAGACGAQVVTNSAGKPLVTSSSPPAGAYGPGQFHSAYNLPTTAPNAQTIAIVDAYDDPNVEADLGTFSSLYGLPQCTTANGCFRKINQSGGTTPPAANASWSLEIALDVEVAHSICQNCKILLVEASSASVGNLATAENRAAASGATVISNSWGAFEFSGETTYESAFNHPGIAITASTGDDGYGVQYPAASRYVTAVGGTTLNLNPDGSWSSETAWSGAGSGCSRYIAKPAWQTDPTCTRRTVGDVSADADPNTGAAVYDSVTYQGESGWFQVGGTSLASPLIAATYALAGNAASLNAGSAPYANPSALHDVASGSNGSCGGSYLCTATSGYDGPTGLGTPNGLGAFGGAGGSPPPPPPQQPDFSLGISPSSSTVTAGTNASFTLTVGSIAGFSSEVDFTQSGLPNAVFAPASVTGSGSTTLTVTTSGVTPGSYPFTISGTSGSTTHTASGTLVVQAQQPPPPPAQGDFSIAVSPGSVAVLPSSTSTYSVTVTPTGGFSSPVTLSTSTLPAGSSASFSPDPATSSSTLTLTVGSGAGGRFGSRIVITITGTSGSLSHSTTLTVLIL
jgi:subtilase family serine protease